VSSTPQCMSQRPTKRGTVWRTAASIAVALPIVAGGLAGCTVGSKLAPGAPGTYQPGASTTGILAHTVLHPHYGDIIITRPGTVIQNEDVHGFIKVRAANVTIRNSRVRGSGKGTTDTALIDANSGAVRNLLVQNCDLTHDYPSVWVDGVIGHDYTALRNNVHNVVDGFGVYNAINHSQNLNVKIAANWVHDLNYISPDPEIYDNHTHNDGIQIQGVGATVGKVQVDIVGNNIQAFAGPGSKTRSPYYPAVTGQAVGITPNVTRVHDVVIDRNWLDGGAQSVTMIPGPRGTGSGIILTNNRFGHGQAVVRMNGVRAQRPVLISPTVSTFAFNNVTIAGAQIRISR
jgi:hypothetical protein